MSAEDTQNPRLPGIRVDPEGTVVVLGIQGHGAILSLDDLKWLVVVGGPAILAGATRVDRLP